MYSKYPKSNFVSRLITQKKYIIIFVVSIIAYSYFRMGITFLAVEELDIPSGLGIDLIRKGVKDVEYSTPISFYNYGGKEGISKIMGTGVGSSIAETRETRQLLGNKKMILGLERILILSEAYSRFGIKTEREVMFKNPLINDTAFLAVCKGKAENILNYDIGLYPTAADFIDGMLKRSVEYNFFSGKYEIIDMFRIVGAEGRNFVLPYIEIKEDVLKITGMALFKDEKMVRKIGIDRARAMNLLRENNVRGMLVLQKNSKEYIAYYATTKRKVRCEKKDNKYNFVIDIALNGEIVENNLFQDIHKSSGTMRKFQNQMSENVEKISYDFINEMQSVYKIDCLELGKVAVAKYGRHTGVDWNEIVSNSDIKVNVEVKVDKMGRGEY